MELVLYTFAKGKEHGRGTDYTDDTTQGVPSASGRIFVLVLNIYGKVLKVSSVCWIMVRAIMIVEVAV